MRKLVSGLLALLLGIYILYKNETTYKKETLLESTVEDFSSIVAEAAPSKNKSQANKTAKKAHEGKASQARGPVSDVSKVLKEFHACYASEKCDYPHSDPKSYLLGLNKDVASYLKTLAARSFDGSPQALQSLRSLMIEGDGFVQEEVLKLFAHLPVSQENLLTILEGTKNNYADPLIMEQVVEELARYTTGESANLVHRFMAETLVIGPQYSAEMAAQKIRPLLNPANLEYYREVAGKTKSSAIRKSLTNSLKDYELSLSGG